MRSSGILAVILLILYGCAEETSRRVETCAAPTREPEQAARLTPRASEFALELELSELGQLLPILVLDTHGAEVVDEPEVDATLSVLEAWDGPPVQELRAGVELRGGHYSMIYDKKQLGLELRGDAGGTLDASLLGMPEDDDWVLSASPLDRSMLKNHVAYELGRRMGLATPEDRFVELFVNQSGGPLDAADYCGLYLAVEKLHSNRSRLGIDEAAGGFLVELTTVDTVWKDELHLCAAWAAQPVVFKYPRDLDPGGEEYQAVEDRLYAFERALFQGDEGDLRAVLDVDSAVDFWLLNAALMNEDAFSRSVFVYSTDGRRVVFGPVWDFDMAMRSDQEELLLNTGNVYGWGRGLVRHGFVRKQLAARWHELREGPLADAEIQAVVDSAWELIAAAAARTDAKWRGRQWVDQDAPDPKGEKDLLRGWLVSRFHWFDEHIDQVQPY